MYKYRRIDATNFLRPRFNSGHRLVVYSLLFLLIYIGFTKFSERYRIVVDITPHRCLNAWIYVLDTYDKTYQPGDIVTIAGAGVPLLPDKYRYTKMVGGVEGQKVSFDGLYVKNDAGFVHHAPVRDIYYELKKKRNLPSEWELGKDKVFLMGDTIYSLDSRVVGLANATYILWKAYVLF